MCGQRVHAGLGDLAEIRIEARAPRGHQLDPVAGGDEQRLTDLRTLHERAQEVRQICRFQHQLLAHGDGRGAMRQADDDDHRLLRRWPHDVHEQHEQHAEHAGDRAVGGLSPAKAGRFAQHEHGREQDPGGVAEQRTERLCAAEVGQLMAEHRARDHAEGEQREARRAASGAWWCRARRAAADANPRTATRFLVRKRRSCKR